MGLAADYRANCDMVDPARNRPDAVYVLTITQARMVTLVLHGSPMNAGFDSTMYIRTTCDTASTEVACNDDAEGAPGHGSLIARIFQPGTYYIFVDGSEDMVHDATQQGAYELDVSLGAPVSDTGSLTRTTGVTCPALPTGTNRINWGVNSDDNQSDALPIGFRMRMLGEDYDYLAIDINGYAQLLQTMSTMPLSTDAMAGNLAIPNSAPPNALVAPFWDDLTVFGIAPRIDTWLDGAAPSRIRHIRWSGVGRYGGGGYNLTFEARLIEGGSIEFHYCTLTGSYGTAHGGSATVGLEARDGTRGFPMGYNTVFLTDNTVWRLDQR